MVIRPEQGKDYRRGDGTKASKMRNENLRGLHFEYRWIDEDGLTYTDDGRHDRDGTSSLDLVAEWVDPVDLTAITEPFGLLDTATQAALKAFGGEIQCFSSSGKWVTTRVSDWIPGIVYRAKPAPKVVTKMIDGWARPDGRILHRWATSCSLPVTATWVEVDDVMDVSTYHLIPREV